MISEKKRSKSKRHWKYGSETRAQRIARTHAIKANSKARHLKARRKKPETPEGKARRIAWTKVSALQRFRDWLETPAVAELIGNRGFMMRVIAAVHDNLEKYA